MADFTRQEIDIITNTLKNITDILTGTKGEKAERKAEKQLFNLIEKFGSTAFPIFKDIVSKLEGLSEEDTKHLTTLITQFESSDEQQKLRDNKRSKELNGILKESQKSALAARENIEAFKVAAGKEKSASKIVFSSFKDSVSNMLEPLNVLKSASLGLGIFGKGGILLSSGIWKVSDVIQGGRAEAKKEREMATEKIKNSLRDIMVDNKLTATEAAKFLADTSGEDIKSLTKVIEELESDIEEEQLTVLKELNSRADIAEQRGEDRNEALENLIEENEKFREVYEMFAMREKKEEEDDGGGIFSKIGGLFKGLSSAISGAIVGLAAFASKASLVATTAAVAYMVGQWIEKKYREEIATGIDKFMDVFTGASAREKREDLMTALAAKSTTKEGLTPKEAEMLEAIKATKLGAKGFASDTQKELYQNVKLQTEMMEGLQRKKLSEETLGKTKIVVEQKPTPKDTTVTPAKKAAAIPKAEPAATKAKPEKEVVVQQAPGMIVQSEKPNRIDTMPADIEDFGLRSLVTGFLQ